MENVSTKTVGEATQRKTMSQESLEGDKLEKELKRLFGVEQLIEEEIKLDENCQSRWYRWSLRELDTYMKLSSLKLKEEPLVMDHKNRCDGLVETMRRRIQVEDSCSEPPMVFGKSKLVRYVWRNPLIRPIWLIIVAYYIIKNAYISYLFYKRDSNFKDWRPMFYPNATRKDRCVLATEPQLGSPFHREAVVDSSEQLDQLGNVFRVTVGIPIFLFQFMGIFVSVLYLLGLVTMRLVEPRCDHLNFIINPRGERLRIRSELDKIVSKLVERLADQTAQSSASASTNLSKNSNNKVFGITRRRREATEYLKLLVGVSHLVMPANLTARWHQILLYLSNGFTPLMIGSQFAGFGSAFVGMTLESIIRALTRVERMRCQQQLGPSGVLAKEIVQLGRLEDPRDLLAYAEHDGSLLGIIKLGIGVEFKYLVTSSRNVLFLFDLSVFMFFTCIVFPTYELLYWYCVVDKLRWLSQVEEQLACCVSLYDRLIVANKLKGEKGGDTNLIKYLTITYLNYRLFTSQLGAFLATAKVFVSPMVVSGVYMMLLSYIIATHTDSLFSRWTLFGMLFFVFQANFYLATGALVLSKSQRIMKSIIRLLTIHQTNTNSSRQIIVDLWRRQLLGPEQLVVLKGINIFGNPISFAILRSLNFYLILLCCFLFRSTAGIPEL